MRQNNDFTLKNGSISGTVDGIMHVTLTKNNTMITLTETNGDVLTWTSCSNCGFVGSQKSTAIATITTAEEMGFRANDLEMRNVSLIFRGGRRFRKAVLRGLARAKVRIGEVILEPVIPYNGCRLKKKRRK